jgi:CBS domain-containing protein
MTVTSSVPNTVFAGLTVRDAALITPKTHPASATVGEIRAFFADDHVHAALLVDAHGRLVSMLERGDLSAGLRLTEPAAPRGTLTGRTAGPDDPLAQAYRQLLRLGRRRLAVTDPDGVLLGLLCFKRSLTGFCTSQDVARRCSAATMFGLGDERKKRPPRKRRINERR